MNAASRMPPALPGGAIARGSLFHVYGPRLGSSNASAPDAAHPPSALAGVSVTISSGGTTVHARLFNVAPDRIVALMPANAPVGAARLAVSRDGQVSEPYALTIAKSAFGIFEVSGSDELSGSARDAIVMGKLTMRTKPPVVRSGEPLYVFGTGIGDAIDSRGLRVFAGSKPARRVAVERRPGDVPGVDRIRVEPTPGTPQGCYVPVLVGTSGVYSNAWAIGVSRDDSCVETLPWLSRAAAGGRRSGTILLLRTSMMTDVNFAIRGAAFSWDAAAASFTSVESSAPAPLPLPPLGTCTVYSGTLLSKLAD